MTKKIINQAIMMFNDHGILSTSLRQIAHKLEISDGHLRYYFKTKEELIIAVYNEMLNRIQAINEVIPKNIDLWETILFQMKNAFKVQAQFSWLYNESYMLNKKYPLIKKKYLEINRIYKKQFIEENLRNIEIGIFDNSLTKERLYLLLDQFLILVNNWIPYYLVQDKSNKINDEVINHYVAVALSIFTPFLNAELKTNIETWVLNNSLSFNE